MVLKWTGFIGRLFGSDDKFHAEEKILLEN